MAVNIIFFVGRASGGGRYLRHILRALEMIRGTGRDGRFLELDNSPRFWTRRLPVWVSSEDTETDEIASHAYDWQSDIGLAEQRLTEAFRLKQIVPLNGVVPTFPSDKERSRERLMPRETKYSDKSEIEKEAIRLRAYVEMRDLEEQARGLKGRGKLRTFFGVIISFDVPVSNAKIRELVDRFLQAAPFENQKESTFKDKPVEVFQEYNRPPFRDCGVVAAIHPEGKWTHVHLWIDVRNIYGQVVQIHPKVWSAQGCLWARIWSAHTGDEQQLKEYQSKVRETAEWKIDARRRIGSGLAPDPRPERVAHLYDQRALKIASQNKTNLLTVGLDPEKFYFAERIMGLRSNEEYRRVMALTKVAEEELSHAYATGASLDETGALELRARHERDHLDALTAARDAAEIRRQLAPKKRLKKQREFQFYMSDRQQEKFDRLKQQRLEAAKDNHQTALLVGRQTVIKSDLKAARKEAVRFKITRKLRPLNFKGREWTLLEIEIEMAERTESKTATRPEVKLKSSREDNKSGIREEELQEIRETLEEHLAEREERIRQKVERAEWRQKLIGKVVKEATEARESLGQPTPVAAYLEEERDKVVELVERHQDAELARHVHKGFRSLTLKPEHAREAAEVEVSRTFKAWMGVLENKYLKEDVGNDRTVTTSEKVAKTPRKSGPRKTGYRRKSNVWLGQHDALRSKVLEKYTGHKLARAVSIDLSNSRRDDFIAAKDYHFARQQIASDCLEEAGIKKEDIVPHLTMADEWRLENLIRVLPRGKERAELKTVLTRIQESRLSRSENEEFLRSVAALHGEVVTERIKQEAARFRKDQYERRSDFEEWDTTGRNGTKQTWTFAGIRHAIRVAPNDSLEDLPERAESIERAIEDRRASYDDEIDSSVERLEELNVNFGRITGMLEINHLQLPPPTFTYEQEREIEQAHATTRNNQAIQEFSRGEAEKDLKRATGRSLARLIVGTVALFIEEQASQVQEEQLGSLLETSSHNVQSGQSIDPEYAQEIEDYLDFRDDERAAVGSYKEALNAVSISLTRDYQGRFGEELPQPVFLPVELQFVRDRVSWLPSDVRDYVVEIIDDPFLEAFDSVGQEKGVEILAVKKFRSLVELPSSPIPQTFQIQPEDPRMRAGRLIGEHLIESLRVRLAGQPGVRSDTSQMDWLGENRRSAVREHKGLYKGDPRAILTEEQNNFLLENKGKISDGYIRDDIESYMQDAIIQGQSASHESLERGPEFERILELSL